MGLGWLWVSFLISVFPGVCFAALMGRAARNHPRWRAATFAALHFARHWFRAFYKKVVLSLIIRPACGPSQKSRSMAERFGANGILSAKT